MGLEWEGFNEFAGHVRLIFFAGRMVKSRLVLTDPAEAAVVEQIEVRLVQPEEETRGPTRATKFRPCKRFWIASTWTEPSG